MAHLPAGTTMIATNVIAPFFVPIKITMLAGFMLGGRIGDPAAIGLDFAFTAIFAAMLIGTWRSRFDLVPWTVAGLAAWLAHLWLPGTWYVVIGAAAGCTVAALTIDPSRATVTHRSEDWT